MKAVLFTRDNCKNCEEIKRLLSPEAKIIEYNFDSDSISTIRQKARMMSMFAIDGLWRVEEERVNLPFLLIGGKAYCYDHIIMIMRILNGSAKRKNIKEILQDMKFTPEEILDFVLVFDIPNKSRKLKNADLKNIDETGKVTPKPSQPKPPDVEPERPAVEGTIKECVDGSCKI